MTFNSYAPPRSALEAARVAGAGAYREGRMVRMVIDGALPDRCMCCSCPAQGYRAERPVYWRPPGWRGAIWGSLALCLALSGVYLPAVS